MKKALAVFLSTLLSFTADYTQGAIVSPNKSESAIEIQQKKEYRLEDLMEDVRANRELNFERAVFLISGAEQDKLNLYVSDLESLIKTENYTGNEYERAKQILKELKKRVKPEDDRWRMQDTLKDKEGNCLVLSILFDLACERQGIKAGYCLTAEHAFNFIETKEGKKYFDLTKDDGIPIKWWEEDDLFCETGKKGILSRLFIWRGNEKYKEGDLEGAEKEYRTSFIFLPKNEVAYDNLVKSYRFSGKLEKALRIMEEYIGDYPKVPELYIYKAGMLLELNKPKDALSTIEKALKFDKKNKNLKQAREEILRILKDN